MRRTAGRRTNLDDQAFWFADFWSGFDRMLKITIGFSNFFMIYATSAFDLGAVND
jgi:hypothetical protein